METRISVTAAHFHLCEARERRKWKQLVMDDLLLRAICKIQCPHRSTFKLFLVVFNAYRQLSCWMLDVAWNWPIHVFIYRMFEFINCLLYDDGEQTHLQVKLNWNFICWITIVKASTCHSLCKWWIYIADWETKGLNYQSFAYTVKSFYLEVTIRSFLNIHNAHDCLDIHNVHTHLIRGFTISQVGLPIFSMFPGGLYTCERWWEVLCFVTFNYALPSGIHINSDMFNYLFGSVSLYLWPHSHLLPFQFIYVMVFILFWNIVSFIYGLFDDGNLFIFNVRFILSYFQHYRFSWETVSV